MILDLSILNEDSKEQILNLYRNYRIEVLEGNLGLDILEKINQIFIKNYEA